MPVKEVIAWDLIGELGAFRLPGGHTVYESVLYSCETARSNKVRLARLTSKDGYLHQINRYVDPDQIVEVLE